MSASKPGACCSSVLILVTISIGGLVEIAPLFKIESTIEKVDGVRPYSPLELVGRNVYIREGCYTCHSQMVRPFRDEAERYGHYSLAAERCTIIRSSGAPSAPAPISRGLAGNTPTHGRSPT